VKAATHETPATWLPCGRRAAGREGHAFSATEAAGAIENLAKAGVSTKDILGGGLKGALNLAAAGQLAVGDAAEIAATAMTQFGLSGKEVPHIADLLAAAAGKAQGEVSDVAMALKQGGLVASQFGLSIEETTGTLAAFASAGLIGSDAGTSFKTMLLALANPSAKAASTLSDLGIAAYDTKGNFVGIAPLAEQLKDKLSKLTPAQRDAALATIFGSDAIRAANVLYQNGAKGITDWTSKVNDRAMPPRPPHSRRTT
jgi:TP901 family phage tail tape measure protein